MVPRHTPMPTSPVLAPYRRTMLRLILLLGAAIAAVILVVMIVGAILHFLFLFAMVALVILAFGLLFGVGRVRRHAARRR